MKLHAGTAHSCILRRVFIGALAILAAGVLAAAPLPGTAQVPPGTEVRIVDVDDSAFPTVRVVIEVEVDGRPATALDPSSLVARETGSPATVTGVERAVDASIPLALVVSLDVSGSMAGTTLASAQDAAVLLLESLAGPDTAALISFSEGARLERPMGTPIAEIVAALRGLQAVGNTALYDAVVLSANIASQAPGGRHAVVLLSDGEDFGGISTATRDGSLARAASSGAVFYVIGVGAGVDTPYLQELAQRTGGRYFAAPGSAEIGAIYQSLSELLRSQFVVTLKSAADPAPREREVQLSIVGDSVVTVTSGYQSRQPLPTPTPLPVTPTPTPTRTPRPPTPTSTPAAGAASTGGGGAGAVAVLGGVLFVVLVGGAGAVLFVRRRRAEPVAPLQSDASALSLPSVNGTRPEARALLLVNGRTYEVTDETGPFAAGSSGECLLQLPAGPGVQALHARLWWRDGRLMVHSLAPGGQTLVNGNPVEWVSLSDGDQLTIGPHVIDYRSPSPGPR